MSHVIGRGRYRGETYPSARGVGFDPTPFLNQLAWFVNYRTGNNAADGKTAQTAVADLAEIRRRWDGGLLGVRPQLPSIAVTVEVVGSPASPFSDPVAVLCDIDAAAGFSMLIDFVTTVKRTGTIATVPNAFARSPTGQQTVTDAGVVSWTADVDQPIQDTTSGAWGWVVAGGSPGTLSATRAQQSAAPADLLNMVDNIGLGAAAIAAGNAYSILTLSSAYFGQQASFRLSPAGTVDPTSSGAAFITIRHASGVTQGASDTCNINGTADYASTGLGACVIFLECACAQPRYNLGGVIHANCFGGTLGRDVVSGELGSACGYLAGYTRRTVFHQGDGAFIDQDFQILGGFDLDFGEAFAGPTGGTAFVGNFGRFLDGASGSPVGFMFGPSLVFFSPFFDAQGIVYGTTSGSALWKLAGLGPGSDSASGGNISIAGTASATFQFDGGTAAFFQAANQSNAFGFNTTTGAWVGPTTMTLAHLDGALAAGTGLGSMAYWFPSNSVILVNQ